MKMSLTAADLDAMVQSADYYQPAGSTLTVCAMLLTNGATVVGTSNVIDPANYNADMGKQVAFANAKGKIWELEGYALKTRIGEFAVLAAKVAHEVNRAWCKSIGDDSQPAWADAPDWQKASAVEGVKAVISNPDTTPEMSHAGWSAHKVADGWVWGAVKDPVKKEHPCLVPYDALPKDQRIKDALFLAAVKSIVA